MYENRRRRRYREKRKPISNETILAVALSAVTILVFVVFLVISIQDGGNTPNLLGGLSVFALIGAIYSLVVGVRAYSNENFDKVMRMFGIIVPAVAVVVWVGLYLMGMFLG